MVKRSPAVGLLFFSLLLTVLLTPQYYATADPFPRQVLLLTSYHQGDRWNDSMVQGVREALGYLESVNLAIENLDLRRYTDPENAQAIKEYLRAKYQGKPQDLVLASDDPALNFLLAVREDLFPTAPVVFCGINNFNPKLIQGQSNITGVNETLSLEATLELAMKLFPQTTRIMAVVSDTEISGRINLEHFRTVAAQMKERVQFGELLNMTDKDAPDILSRLPENSLVLRLINLLNSEGGYLSIQDSIRILSTHAPVPVFTAWSFDLGEGALGGYVASSQEQGRTAGNLAIRILGGQGADQIPVVMDSPNVPMFDYKVMERFGLKESSLPQGSVVLNHQVSVLEQYWGWLLGFVAIAVLQMFLIVTLLTRGKRLRAANASLQDSEHFTRSLLEAIPVPVFYKGRDGRYQGFNQAFLHFYGKDKDELIGKSVFDITPLDIAKVYHAKDMELFEKPGIQVFPYEVKTSQGDLRDVIFHRASLTDEHGVVTGLIGAILDVTELKRMEKRNQVLADIIRHSQDFIGVADMKQMAFFVNPAGQALVGLDGDEAVAKTTIEEYFLTEDLPFVQNTILPAVMKEGRWAGEFRFRHFKTGKPVPVLYELFLTEYPETGAAINFATITRDITELRQAQEEKEKLQAQLSQAQKMESVGCLAGGVAHDFNNMLGVIIGLTDILLMNMASDNPFHAHLTEIRKAGERSADLTRQLLTFARKQTVAPKMLDFNDTIENMLKLLRRLIGEDIDLLWKPGDGLWPVKMDPTQIDQILANLCVNARDAIGGVGKVTIETDNISFDEEYCTQHMDFVPGDYVLLAVSDNGYGMDTKTISHLFEPFFTTKELGKGTGLGLATVYGAVKQNNGFINVYSEPGHGTTFKIYLPRHAAKAAVETKEPKPQDMERCSETILLVEDEPAILRMTTMMLELPGYTVLAASTPGEALRLAQEHPGCIDLVLTDVVMPEMNGRDLIKNLLSIYPDMRRLFMSGYTADIIAHHGVLDEGVQFIQKPFSMEDLAAKVREALERE